MRGYKPRMEAGVRHNPARWRIRAALAAAAATLAAGFAATPAEASRGQLTVVQDDTQIVRRDAAARDAALDEFKADGADVIKIMVFWGEVAGPGAGEYPAENWKRYDYAIAAAHARGLRVMIGLGGRAPGWASQGDGGHRDPDPEAFRKFVELAGGRWGGPAYTDPLGQAGGGGPRVDLWSLWNEPNLDSWLSPQYKGNTPYSPHLYRRLLIAAKQGLDASGHGSDQLLIGELLPFVRSGGSSKSKIRPVQFLREMACVDSKYRPLTGKSASARGCDGFQPLPGTGVAIHPYTFAGGPRVPVNNQDDVTIASLSRLTKALDRLDARGRLATKKMPVWITEFGFQTDPPDPFQADIGKVPGFMGESERFAYVNKRVASYAQYTLFDDPVETKGDSRYSGWQGGLRYSNGKAKPGVYRAFQLPFFVNLRGDSSVEVFGGVRTGAAGQTVTLQVRSGSKYKKLATLTLGEGGYFRKALKLSSARKRVLRFVSGSTASNALRPS